MLRPSYCLTALIAALTTLIAVLAHSQPLPTSTNRITPQTVSEPLPNVVMPVCYIQLENGQLRDLGRLCGKKATSPTSSRGVQRPAAKPDPDSDDDDSTSAATPKPRSTPSKASPAASTPSLQPTSTSPASASSPLPSSKPTPQPTGSLPPNTPSRPANGQPSPTAPSTSAPSSSNPLAIPEDDSR